MVCAIGSGKMAAFARLLDVGSVSQTATEEIDHRKLAAQYFGRELRNVDEANLLDEEDMHIFGLKPMTDPLDLVCCNACKKPIKASQYAAHAELCKSLLRSGDTVNLELDGHAVNRKPPRKERKKLPTTQIKKVTLVRQPKRFESIDSDDIAAPESQINEKIEISPFTEVKRNMHLNSVHNMSGLQVNPCIVDCSEDVNKRSSKPLKRVAAESPPNPGAKNLCKTTVEVLPYVPAPLATKIYYSQRNHLRRAICHMLFEESRKESSSEVQNLESLQRDNSFLHLAQTPDQIVAARSGFHAGNSGVFIPCVDAAAQLPVNNILEPHYVSNSYSFTDKAGSCLSTLQQGSDSVSVV